MTSHSREVAGLSYEILSPSLEETRLAYEESTPTDRIYCRGWTAQRIRRLRCYPALVAGDIAVSIRSGVQVAIVFGTTHPLNGMLESEPLDQSLRLVLCPLNTYETLLQQ